MSTKSFETFLADVAVDATVGANAYVNTSLGDDCGWLFGGYALPLLDPEENHTRETAQSPDCASWWTPYLNYHVFTTSTSTVYIRDNERWRIYMQDAELASDTLVNGETARPVYPYVHPGDTAVTRYPIEDPLVTTATPWTDSGEYDATTGVDTRLYRFSNAFISFVDSPDGGRTFPVYAPVMSTGRFNQQSDEDGCPSSWDTVSGSSGYNAPDWSGAGWTTTIVPCQGVTPSTDGTLTYSIYRDVSVIDLFTEHGIYLMFAAECRSLERTADIVPAECSPCTPCTSTDACDNPYTRLVVIASTSPDFPTDGSPTGEVKTWPAPLTDHSVAMVCVQPDTGAEGPFLGGTPNEWYGVPHVVLTPDRETLVLYVGWQTNAKEDCVNTTSSRVTDFYGATNAPWAHLGNGISCFAVDASTLAMAVELIWLLDWYGEPTWILTSENMRTLLMDLVSAGYQGEVLISDGTSVVVAEALSDFDGEEVPTLLEYNGAHFLFCGCDQDNLWVYYDVSNVGGWSGGWSSQIRRAALAVTSNFPRDMQHWLEDNGEFTLFLAPEDCALAMDFRLLFATDPAEFAATDALCGDLDVVALHGGRLRMSFTTMAEGEVDLLLDGVIDEEIQLAGGLACAYGPPTACDLPVHPFYPTFDPETFDPMGDGALPAFAIPPPALPQLAARVRSLSPTARKDPGVLAELLEEFVDAACADGLAHIAGGKVCRGPHPLAAAFHALANRPENLRGQRAIAALANRPENLRGQRALAAAFDRPENLRGQRSIVALMGCAT